MLKSIQDTKKLFTIEGIQNGQVEVKISKHLLSLSEDAQTKILKNQMETLNKDLSKYEAPDFQSPNDQEENIDKMQLQLLIQVIEQMLSQI